MKIKMISVGGKMPAWVDSGVQEYVKRMPRELPVDFFDIPLSHRSKNSSVEKAIAAETKQILAAVGDRDLVIALEVKGKAWSTEKLASNLQAWQFEGRDIAILIGGPDGLGQGCRDRADMQWSLSDLTLPHPIVRVVLVEQLYRAWTINQNHPYHRS